MKIISRILDRLFPSRHCARVGHDWAQSYRFRRADDDAPLGAPVVRVPDMQCQHCGAYRSDL